jgi:hypothetical protein
VRGKARGGGGEVVRRRCGDNARGEGEDERDRETDR